MRTGRPSKLKSVTDEDLWELARGCSSYAEIAEHLGISERTLGRRLSNRPIRDAIRRVLEANRLAIGALRSEKRCSVCSQVKTMSEFPLGGGSDGRGATCNRCARRRAKRWNDDHRGQAPEPVVSDLDCPACHRLLPSDEFWRSTKNTTGLQVYCKECQGALSAGVSVEEIASQHGIAHRRSRRDWSDLEVSGS